MSIKEKGNVTGVHRIESILCGIYMKLRTIHTNFSAAFFRKNI